MGHKISAKFNLTYKESARESTGDPPEKCEEAVRIPDDVSLALLRPQRRRLEIIITTEMSPIAAAVYITKMV
jgi:hypothetical protein